MASPFVTAVFPGCLIYLTQQARQMFDAIKTHDSESQGQEEVAIIRETKITRPLSEEIH